jgi:2-C-methyl-D-erythritol 4-phosphate cytidylyltransferase
MNIALLTAAGSGTRMHQSIPKQFMDVDGIPVIAYTMMAFQGSPDIDAIGVVCLSGWEDTLRDIAKTHGISKLKWVFEGGASNQESIGNGLRGLEAAGCSREDIVLVHDGVRPLVDNRIIADNIATCKEFGYAVTGLQCKEAIMQVKDGCLDEIEYPREMLIRTQTPHTYRLGTLLDAHKEAAQKGVGGTVASCTLLAALGRKDQHLVTGSERNGLKLTLSEDVDLFRAMIKVKITNP